MRENPYDATAVNAARCDAVLAFDGVQARKLASAMPRAARLLVAPVASRRSRAKERQSAAQPSLILPRRRSAQHPELRKIASCRILHATCVAPLLVRLFTPNLPGFAADLCHFMATH
jgi:hypothetical protein